ncbi:threonine synthase [Kribbella aluminosa]|uniref:Threonine synthase n=1 Tax=Kribbella aluminosa TaxID=416017 RepID=A0ABS4UDD5_9ACTN|nr:pyridoxal-phosphate dependent enzyme [Kribbella aluminosa]MBP2349655.1 threonine synthase [Kribbella aluminosa]
MSRFAHGLPAVREFVCLGEGGTPVVDLPALARRLGVRSVSAKLETSNPTGSYKDRVAALSMSLARSQGYRGWIATSSGNAGMAMAAYGARAGIPGFLCLAGSVPPEKSLPLLAFGADAVRVVRVNGAGRPEVDGDMFDQVRDAAARHRLYLGVTLHAFNPQGMRGIDTIAYELAEQVPKATHVYAPVGGGGLVVALARGLAARGLDPRLVACQPSGCAPVVRFLAGEIPAVAIERSESEISALQLPRPPDGEAAAEAVARSQGWGTAIDDATILVAQRWLAAAEGLFVEPAAAVTVAALVADADSERLGPDARPVLILTGGGWKDLGRFAPDAARLKAIDIGRVSRDIDEWVDSGGAD